MSPSTRLLIPFLVLGSISILAHAQDKQQPPVFTSGTSFVQVPVIVQRSGKHVSGLKKDDFNLRQDDERLGGAAARQVVQELEAHFIAPVDILYNEQNGLFRS